MPESLKSRPGYWSLDDWRVLELTGPDVRDYLNRLSTRDFKKDQPEKARLGAFLTGRSTLVALGYFVETPTSVFFVADRASGDAGAEHIEKFHFAEQMELRDRSDEFSVYVTRGQPSAGWKDAALPDWTWVLAPRGQKPPGEALPREQFDYERLKAGVPRLGVEAGDTVLILEANLERAVDRNKGCYPGQEVVERIFTYGQVNRKLLPVSVKGDWQSAELPLKFMLDGKPAAFLVSALANPEDPAEVSGLAFVYRAFWDYPGTISEAGVEMQLRRGEK